MFLSTFHFHLLFLPLLPMGCCVVCSWIQCWFARYVFCRGWRWFIEVALPSSSSSWEDGPTRGRVGSAACLCLSRQFDFDKDPRDTSTQGAEITRFYLYPSPERHTHTRRECQRMWWYPSYPGRGHEGKWQYYLWPFSLLFNKKELGTSFE